MRKKPKYEFKQVVLRDEVYADGHRIEDGKDGKATERAINKISEDGWILSAVNGYEHWFFREL